jgi:hypothetical protein
VKLVSFLLLLVIRLLAKIFYRHEVVWVGDPVSEPWKGIRITTILNHTSLYEPLLIGVVPIPFVWQVSRHGVVPVAKVTMDRPVTGRLFRLMIGHPIPISRKRDGTWSTVMSKVDDPRSIVVILPEGRMKRADGLDKEGQPMSVRGGIADVLQTMDGGRMLLAYSEGLHHIQVPGEQRLPKLFKTIRLRLEVVEIDEYRAGVVEATGNDDFTGAVIEDLTRRRDLYCPPDWADRGGER